MTGTEPRFDGRVAIVTGAGRGVGRAHARLLARLGCCVVVNDLGSDPRGDGASTEPATEVVEEIVATGGRAVADGRSIADEHGAAELVAMTLERFGRLDIVINNAGTSRAPWQQTIDVHLAGTYRVCAAAWPILAEQGYGRILNTTSAAGLFGLPRPVGDPLSFHAYAAAKMGVVGLTRGLACDGRDVGITVNALAPVAYSRLTAEQDDERSVQWLRSSLGAEHVAVAAAALVHEECTLTGRVFSVGGGRVAEVEVTEESGITVSDGDPTTVLQWLQSGERGQRFVPRDTYDEMRAFREAVARREPDDRAAPQAPEEETS